jgi:hypothetical protein
MYRRISLQITSSVSAVFSINKSTASWYVHL